MSLLKPVESSERNLSGWDFFLLWAGAAIALTEIWAGGFLVPLGLAGGLLAIVLGHIIGNTPLALAGLIGSRLGVPSIVSTRAALGNRGSLLPAALNVIQLVGWTAVMLWISGHAARRLTPDHPWLTENTWIVISGILTTAWTLGGHRAWKWLQRTGVLLLFAFSILVTVVVFRTCHPAELLARKATGDLPFMLGLDLVIAMPVSWLPLVCDYSRYAANSRTGAWGAWWGYLLAGSWMYAVGLCAALATRTDQPDHMVLDLMASSGLVVSGILIVLLSTITTTFLDIYSNSISVQSIFPKWNERAVSLAGGLLGTGLALLLQPQQYESFLLFIGASFCPLFGIVLADFFILRRGRYDAGDLFARGRYWYTGGFNLPALAIWLAGFLLFQASSRLGWPIGASLPSMAFAALLHVTWARLFRKESHV
jgi:putative hydroxymethylpyrimidine transporter CytX